MLFSAQYEAPSKHSTSHLKITHIFLDHVPDHASFPNWNENIWPHRTIGIPLEYPLPATPKRIDHLSSSLRHLRASSSRAHPPKRSGSSARLAPRGDNERMNGDSPGGPFLLSYRHGGEFSSHLLAVTSTVVHALTIPAMTRPAYTRICITPATLAEQKINSRLSLTETELNAGINYIGARGRDSRVAGESSRKGNASSREEGSAGFGSARIYGEAGAADFSNPAASLYPRDGEKAQATHIWAAAARVEDGPKSRR